MTWPQRCPVRLRACGCVKGSVVERECRAQLAEWLRLQPGNKYAVLAAAALAAADRRAL